MPKPVKTVAILVAKAGKADELRALLEGLVTSSRNEPANLRYDLWQDRADPTRFVLDELYTGPVAVETHRATPHFQHYASVIASLAERTAVTLDPVAVA